MATVGKSATLGTIPVRATVTSYALGGLRFDLAAVLLSCWLIFGLYLDGWSHLNLGRIESFLTPWHAVLYSGFAAGALFLAFHQVRNMQHGSDWRRALPEGYLLSLIGAGVWMLGGALDFVWHSVFGFEVNVEALLSPTHMVLAVGGALMVTGPLRAAWRRSNAATPAGWEGLLPALVSLFLLLSVVTFFTQYVHFTSDPRGFVGPRPENSFHFDLLGVSSALIYSAALMGAVLFALGRWTLPVGSMTLLISVNTLMMFLMRYRGNKDLPWLAVAVMIAGVAADLLLLAMRPSAERPGSLRVFAFLVPWTIFLSYYLALIITAGTWWSIHMWLGVPVQAGVVGLFLSYLVLPPETPTTQ